MTRTHSFHIPVMGIGFTVDTPLKVSRFGIDSVISLVDDILLEKLRKMYCEKFKLPYEEITEKMADYRAKRITSYLNLINTLAKEKYEAFRAAVADKSEALTEYLHLLPESSVIKQKIREVSRDYLRLDEVRVWLKEHMRMGSIDVNIMTKLDKENFSGTDKLPVEYNDAYAALRGYANSDLDSAIVLSAGMHPRLYGYMEQFDDFFPDADGYIKKKIILKVSDYRSAITQGRFLAKKGLWVSEYRIESGLNCGGHAFASDGYLLGPIFAEFRDKREEMTAELNGIYRKALARKNRTLSAGTLPLAVTAQGGVGTAEEHEFLLDHYKVDSVGWGTPFLLVPEAVSIDKKTMQQLIDAGETDLYLSDTSPVGVPFNTLRGNTKDAEKQAWIDSGTPGSPCPKRFLVHNREFTEKQACTASRQYQRAKLKELDAKNLPEDQYRKEHEKIVEKSCICVGLGTSALMVHGIDTAPAGDGVSVCPGPNMAYFSRKMNLKEMVDHIYGRANWITRSDRPHMFVKELGIYLEYFREKIDEAKSAMSAKQEQYLLTFAENLKSGINYYHELFSGIQGRFVDTRAGIIRELEASRKTLQRLKERIGKLLVAE